MIENVGFVSKFGETYVVPVPCTVVFTLVQPLGLTKPVLLSTF